MFTIFASLLNESDLSVEGMIISLSSTSVSSFIKTIHDLGRLLLAHPSASGGGGRVMYPILPSLLNESNLSREGMMISLFLTSGSSSTYTFHALVLLLTALHPLLLVVIVWLQRMRLLCLRWMMEFE